MAIRVKRCFRRRTHSKPDRSWWSSLRPDRNKPKNVSIKPTEWISWKLRSPNLASLFSVTLLLISAILVLLVLSNRNHGFIAVQNAQKTIKGVNLKLSYTWTILPSVVFQIYGLCFAAVVDAFGFRQPFVELARGAVAQKSIALDYLSFFPVQREIEAFRRGHWRVGFACLLSLLFIVGIGPLGAHLLTDHDYSGPQNAYYQQNSTFHASYDLASSLAWDFSPVLGTVSSALVYGGSYPRWSNGTHAFLNLSLIDPPLGDFAQPIIKVRTEAYFASLDCQVMEHVETNITRLGDSQASDETYGTWSLHGTDRGCDWKTRLQISQGFETYLQTSSHDNCSSYGNSSKTGRLVVIGASNVDFNNSLPTVVTCIPIYWHSQGLLHMSLNLDSRNSILGFDSDASEELRPQWWNSFEKQMNQVLSVDTTGDGGVSSDSATALGKIILENARKLDQGRSLSGDVLIQSSQQVFGGVYSTLVDTFMIRNNDDGNKISGQLIITEHKLFIDNVVSGIMMGFLFAASVLLVVIHTYTHAKTHRSILYEEPIGLLSYAGLLTDSVVNKIVVNIRGMENYQGNTTEIGTSMLGGPNAPSFVAVHIDDPRHTYIEMRTSRESPQAGEEAFASSPLLPTQQTATNQQTTTSRTIHIGTGNLQQITPNRAPSDRSTERTQQTNVHPTAFDSTDRLVAHDSVSLLNTPSEHVIELREFRESS